jgi:antitoxin component of RelBE/YafQ-DinJ toxin-antitoxin module
MGKQNLTVQLDSETVQRAKVVAAKRGLSMSALVSQQIEKLTAADERYERARESALRMMADVSRHASELDPAAKNLGRTWTREGLYEERLSRYAR